MMSRKFQAGGTLIPERSVYVERSEDGKFMRLAEIEKTWINVYGCRTMGKSSLYVQHLRSLRASGIKPIVIDVASQVGTAQLTPRGWVSALAEAISVELAVDSEQLRKSVTNLPADTTTGRAIERLLLESLGVSTEPLLLVLDEYDCIRQLDYCDDILFAFRHIQSLQARSNALDKLSICLVGLQPLTHFGTPGAANTSPIAATIELLDFEKSPSTFNALMNGFPREQVPDESVVSRVLELSGGQPLVTMELLRGVEEYNCRTPDAVDRMSKDLVADSGQGKDLQLFEAIERAFVGEGGNAFAALRAYEALLKGSKEAHSAPGSELLLLFGLARRKKQRLEVKGELFLRRFDGAWADRMLSRIASRIEQYRGASKRDRKRICLINTGGTLGMVERGNRVVAPRDADEYRSYFTALDSIAEVELTNLFDPRDSINVFPDQWSTLARYIYNRRNDGFDGFVVAHGTDTMAYTASAVAFALGPQLRFPVVFTGAQTTPDVPYGDAHVNLYRACEVAKKDIPEVVISFGNFVYRAVRAQKKDDRRFDGFESPTYPPLAEITGEIDVRKELLRPLPKRNEEIQLHAEFEASILVVPQFPGLEPNFFEHLLQENSQQVCKGVIVQTLGAGNIASEPPYSFIPFVERAFRQGIPLIVTSQYPPDPDTHTKYAPGEAPIHAGAIQGGNMTMAAAVAKFRWVLADVARRRSWRRLTPNQKRKLVERLMVYQSVVGEF